MIHTSMTGKKELHSRERLNHSNQALMSGCPDWCIYLYGNEGKKKCRVRQVNPKKKIVADKLFFVSLRLGIQIICDYNKHKGDFLHDMDVKEEKECKKEENSQMK